MEQDLKQIGKRISASRKDMDLTQKEFATQMNMSNNHLSNIERGRSAPSFMLFLDICTALNANIEYIATGRVYPDLDKEVIEKIKKCSDEDKIKISKIIDVFIKQWTLAILILLSYNQISWLYDFSF